VRAFADVGIFEMLEEVLAALIDATSVSGLVLYLVIMTPLLGGLVWTNHLDDRRGATMPRADSAAAQDSFSSSAAGVRAGEQKAIPESILQAT
jgi:hypothetical protein